MASSEVFQGANLRALASVVVATTLVLGLFFIFEPFLIALVMGGILASISRPLYNQLERYLKIPGLSALATLLLVLGLLLVPFVGLGSLLASELSFLRSALESGQFNFATLATINGELTSFLGVDPLPLNPSEILTKSLSFIANRSTWILGSVLGALGTGFLVLVTTFYILQSQDKFRKAILSFSPLSPKDSNLIIDRAHEVIRATISGNLLLMVLQGMAAIINFSIFGVSTPILLGSLYGLASVTPTFGAVLIWSLVTLYELSQGAYLSALGISLWIGAQVIAFDYYLGPRLIEHRAKLHPLLVLLGLLGGVVKFGLVGLILGPAIVALGMVGLEILNRFWQVPPD